MNVIGWQANASTPTSALHTYTLCLNLSRPQIRCGSMLFSRASTFTWSVISWFQIGFWTTSSMITGTTADSTQNCMQILHTYHFQLSRYHGRMQAIEEHHNACHLGSKSSKMSPLQRRSRLCGIKHCFLADPTETLYPRFDARLAAGQIEGDIRTSRRNRHQLQSAIHHPIESLQDSPLLFPVPA